MFVAGLTLYHNGEMLYSYSPYGNEKLWHNDAQWWVTGFDARTQNVKQEDLEAVTSIDFFKMENGETYETVGWSFSNERLTATLGWK